MSFHEYTPPTVTLETNSTPITLRGLNTDDLTGLIQRHGALIETWFEGEIDFSETLVKAPRMVADMIACAAGEPEAVDIAASMPITLQLRAIAEVFRLTFSEIELGNIVRLFVTTFAGTEQPMTMQTRSI